MSAHTTFPTILTLDRVSFQSAVVSACRFVEKRNSIPILDCLRLRSQVDTLQVISHDLDRESTTTLAAPGQPPIDVCLPGHRLKDILAKAPKGESSIVLTLGGSETEDGKTGNNVAALQVGALVFNVVTRPAKDFPTMKDHQGDVTAFDLATVDFARLLNKTSVAISTEETRYSLNGIFWHLVKGDLVAVATDGHRLARYTMPAPVATMPSVIVPSATVAELRRAASAKGAAPSISIRVSQTRFETTLGNTRILSKIIDGTFPDYLRVIPASNDGRCTVDRAAFESALSQIKVVRSARGPAAKLTFADDVLTLSTVDPENGNASIPMPAEINDRVSRGFEIGFNTAYLTSLSALVDDDRLTLALGDAGSPALILDPSDSRLTIVLMPMRV